VRHVQRLLAKSADNKDKNDKERFNYDKQYASYMAITKGTGQGFAKGFVNLFGPLSSSSFHTLSPSQKTTRPHEGAYSSTRLMCHRG
jgi:hypothetical protein